MSGSFNVFRGLVFHINIESLAADKSNSMQLYI